MPPEKCARCRFATLRHRKLAMHRVLACIKLREFYSECSAYEPDRAPWLCTKCRFYDRQRHTCDAGGSMRGECPDFEVNRTFTTSWRDVA